MSHCGMEQGAGHIKQLTCRSGRFKRALTRLSTSLSPCSVGVPVLEGGGEEGTLQDALEELRLQVRHGGALQEARVERKKLTTELRPCKFSETK